MNSLAIKIKNSLLPLKSVFNILTVSSNQVSSTDDSTLAVDVFIHVSDLRAHVTLVKFQIILLITLYSSYFKDSKENATTGTPKTRNVHEYGPLNMLNVKKCN